MHENTEFTLTRDCEAIQIPSGQKITIPPARGRHHADTRRQLHDRDLSRSGAHRRKRPRCARFGKARSSEWCRRRPTTATAARSSEKAVWDNSSNVIDPEIPVNIVDLGLVYDCQLIKKPEGGTKVEVKMTLTAPGCGMGPAIAHDAQSKISASMAWMKPMSSSSGIRRGTKT